MCIFDRRSAATCLLIASLAAPATCWAQSAGVGTPYADYHTHLYSANVSGQRIRMPRPAVEVPAEMAALLDRRASLTGGREAFRNRLALRDVYTADALAQHRSFRNWVSGPLEASFQASIHATLTFNGQPNRLTPVGYATSDSVGWVAGYFTQGQGTAARHVGHFHLGLHRAPGAPWRIATESSLFPGPEPADVSLPRDLIVTMDAAGVRKALVLASSYWYGSSIREGTDAEYAAVRAENDWVAAQVSAHPNRLVGFCSFNPLRAYAEAEIARCAKDPRLRGIKLHVADANADLRNPVHVAQLRRVFAAANQHRLPIAAHIANQDLGFGRAEVEIYLNDIFSAAPDITIQIAHLAGHGPSHGGEALTAFADAVAANDPRVRNLYFDVASNAQSWADAAYLADMARTIRRLGVERVLFATDWPAGGGDFTLAEAWRQFRRMPLTEAEFAGIADNVMAYMR